MYCGRCVYTHVAACFTGMFDDDGALDGTTFVPTSMPSTFAAFNDLDIITDPERTPKGDFSARLCVTLGQGTSFSGEVLYPGRKACLGVRDAFNYNAESYSEDMEIANPPFVLHFDFPMPAWTLPDAIIDEIEEGLYDHNNRLGEPETGNWDANLEHGVADLMGFDIMLNVKLENLQPRVEHAQPGLWRFASFGLMCVPILRYPGNPHFDFWNMSEGQDHLSDAMTHAFLFEAIELGRGRRDVPH